MKTLTALFIRLNFEYKHSSDAFGYREYPAKSLGNLRYHEGIINPHDIPQELYKELDYYSFSSSEFFQPCFSNELTVKELLAHIISERGGMRDYYTLENGILRCYHPYKGTVSTLYPWCVSRQALRRFRRASKYGTFILGVDRLSAGNVFGGKVYKYL